MCLNHSHVSRDRNRRKIPVWHEKLAAKGCINISFLVSCREMYPQAFAALVRGDPSARHCDRHLFINELHPINSQTYFSGKTIK